MAADHANKKVAALVCSALLFGGCADPHADTWDVLLGAIPQRVSLGNLGETGNYYVVRQTHEALFRRDDGQHYTSRLLKSWSRGLDNRKFVFCPDTSLGFSEQKAFSADYFGVYISSVTGNFSGSFRVSADGGCFSVEFPVPSPGYLEFLALLENAPSIPDVAGNPTGLGPFAVESIAEDRVVLVRKRRVDDGYNKIVLHEYAGPGDPRLNDRGIEDFNKLSSFDQPEWIAGEFQRFYNVELKSVSLMINHPRLPVRKTVHDCLDVDAFRRAFAPKRKDFYDIRTVLPAGMPGSEPGRFPQHCKTGGVDRFKGVTLRLINQKTDNLLELGRLLEDFKNRTGVNIVLKNMSPKEVSPLLKGGPKGHQYELILIVLDTVAPDYDVFFEYILGDSATIDNLPGELRDLYAGFKKTGRWGDRAEAARVLANKLNEYAIALPLYQTIVPIYYPRNIKNINVGRGFAQYPEVADFRW